MTLVVVVVDDERRLEQAVMKSIWKLVSSSFSNSTSWRRYPASDAGDGSSVTSAFTASRTESASFSSTLIDNSINKREKWLILIKCRMMIMKRR